MARFANVWRLFAASCLLVLSLGAQSREESSLPAPFTSTWANAPEVANDARFKTRFLAAHGGSEAVGGPLRALVMEFAGRPWPVHTNTHAYFLERMRTLELAVDTALVQAAQDGAADSAAEQARFKTILDAAGFAPASFEPQEKGPENNERLVYFDSERAGVVSFVAYENTSTDNDVRYVLHLTDAEMLDLRLRTGTITALLTDSIAKLRVLNVEQLELAVERWTNYLDKGYSQYPWESFLNGKLLDIPELGPPDRQWIILHPALGVELSTRSLDDMTVKEALNIEVLGHLWYRGKKLDDYSGVSAALTLRSDLGPGFGALFHVSKGINLGVSWHDVDDDGRYFDDAPYAFFSLDLYSFVSKPASLLSERFDKERARRDAARR